MNDTLFGLDAWMSDRAEDSMISDLVMQETIKNETCRHCKHRQRWGFNYSNKITQHCALQPDKRNRTGLKRIKVTDKACDRFAYLNQDRGCEYEL